MAAVIGVSSLVIGAVQRGKANKIAKNAAEQGAIVAAKAASQNALTNLEVGESSNVASIINATLQSQAMQNAAAQTAAITAQGSVKVASLNQQGNALLLAGSGLLIITLGALVLRRNQEPT